MIVRTIRESPPVMEVYLHIVWQHSHHKPEPKHRAKGSLLPAGGIRTKDAGGAAATADPLCTAAGHTTAIAGCSGGVRRSRTEGDGAPVASLCTM